MKSVINIAAAAIALGVSSTAIADIPTLGGDMSHLLVTLFDNEIYVTFETPAMATVEMQDVPGDFTGAASVLNNKHGYNGQFGWLANGFISLPPASGIFVRTIEQSEYLTVFEESTFDPILGTRGSSDVWQWDGTMTHNWYAASLHGPHSASYEVFVGDLAGNPLDGYRSGFVELNFAFGSNITADTEFGIGDLTTGTINPINPGLNRRSVGAVPAPGAMGLLALGGLGVCKRRRH